MWAFVKEASPNWYRCRVCKPRLPSWMPEMCGSDVFSSSQSAAWPLDLVVRPAQIDPGNHRLLNTPVREQQSQLPVGRAHWLKLLRFGTECYTTAANCSLSLAGSSFSSFSPSTLHLLPPRRTQPWLGGYPPKCLYMTAGMCQTLAQQLHANIFCIIAPNLQISQVLIDGKDLGKLSTAIGSDKTLQHPARK